MPDLNVKVIGNNYEKEIAQAFKIIDSTSSRNRSSGSGIYKSDTHNSLGYNFECKRVEKLNIFKAIEQSKRDAQRSYTTPAVVFKKGGMIESWIAVPLSHFIEIKRKSLEPKTENPDREFKFLLQRIKDDCTKLIKRIPL